MTRQRKEFLLNIALIAGLLVIVAMAVLPLLMPVGQWMRVAFAAGAALVLVARLFQRYDGDNIRIKRLYRINIVSALLFCCSAALMFIHTDIMGYLPGPTDWVALLMAGAALQIYASFALDNELKKSAKK